MITTLIIAITALVSIPAFYNKELQGRLLFSPIMIAQHRQGYRFLTHAFVHADWMHLVINMFVLLSFGRAVEGFYSHLFGAKGWYFFLLLYFGGILLSSTPSYARHKDNKFYHAVGASGAVSAVVFASILISPLTGIRFIFIPFDIPAFIFGILYLIYSAYMARRGNDNIGHDAHFWGAVYGLLFTFLLKPALGIAFVEQIASYVGLA